MRVPGYRYALAGFVAALLAVAALVLMNLAYERAAGIGSGGWTLRGVIVVGIFYGLPLVLAAAAVVAPGRAAAALRWISAAGFFLLVPLFAFAGGLFFLPAAGLMLVSAIKSGERTRTPHVGPSGSS